MPLTVNGPGNKMRDWCDQAELFHHRARPAQGGSDDRRWEQCDRRRTDGDLRLDDEGPDDALYELSDRFSSVVPHAGVEPALLSKLDFESSASTNSANGATDTDEPGV